MKEQRHTDNKNIGREDFEEMFGKLVTILNFETVIFSRLMFIYFLSSSNPTGPKDIEWCCKVVCYDLEKIFQSEHALSALSMYVSTFL